MLPHDSVMPLNVTSRFGDSASARVARQVEEARRETLGSDANVPGQDEAVNLAAFPRLFVDVDYGTVVQIPVAPVAGPPLARPGVGYRMVDEVAAESLDERDLLEGVP